MAANGQFLGIIRTASFRSRYIGQAAPSSDGRPLSSAAPRSSFVTWNTIGSFSSGLLKSAAGLWTSSPSCGGAPGGRAT